MCQEWIVTCSLVSTALKLSYTNVKFHEENKGEFPSLPEIPLLETQELSLLLVLNFSDDFACVLFYTCHFPSTVRSVPGIIDGLGVVCLSSDLGYTFLLNFLFCTAVTSEARLEQDVCIFSRYLKK